MAVIPDRAMQAGAVLLLLSVVFGTAASAQPSDNDIFASYCLGVLIPKEQGLKTVAKLACTEERKFSVPCLKFSKDSEATTARLASVRRYLVARGYLTGADRLSHPGLNSALRSADTDVEECDESKDQDPICLRLRRCDDVSRLPM